ncbi:MAG: cell division protein FtsX [Bacteroidetes bacterium]|nr:MAG: cell division protein FtsX [Bacteroidota bacterium]
MFRNYFKIAIRNLWRNKIFSGINVFGLALGIATCLLIILFIQNELSYDRFNKKSDQIYRVVFRGSMEGGEIKEANVMPPVAQTFKNEYPEVLEATRIRNDGRPRISYGTKTYRESELAFADSNFFQVFSLPFIEGDPKTALLEPYSVVITRTTAKKFFGNEDALGKVLEFKDQKATLKVTGVIEDVPQNSHFHFDLFGSMSTLPEANSQTWLASNFFTYLVLPKGYDYKKLEAKFPLVVEKYISPQLKQAMGLTIQEFQKKGNKIGFYLQPLTDIHLHSDLTGDIEAHGDIRYVYIFSAVAVFMLLLACINFMNLSTAGASKRAREVGVRKVLGSMKWELVRQFLVESFILTGLSMVIALLIVYWAIPIFNNLANQNLSLHLQSNKWVIPTLIGFAIFTGLLAGSYPAFYLSSFNPVTVLKGKFSSNKKSIGLRSGLVVFQFFVSICLIIGTTVVYRQLSYIQQKKLGYDRDQVMVVEEIYWLGQNKDAFRQQLLQDPRVARVSESGYLPAGSSFSNNYFAYPDTKSTQMVKSVRYDVDYDYIPTLGMDIVAGRNFSKEFGTDSSGVILNETAARAFGWNQDALGHTITHLENDGKKFTYHVVGVVKDFHFRSLHEMITPLVMIMDRDYSFMIVKTKTKDIQGLIETMKQKWTALTSESPFIYSFLDDRFNNTYKAEQNIGNILGIFAGLTIFVACLGLFGLATFTAEQRTKEIGIRKVLGANVSGIVSLLSKDFLKLVFVAFIIACPVAWFVMNKWLQEFAYRTQINWWIFVSAAFIAIIITIITISFQAIKAALANPVNSLRSE